MTESASTKRQISIVRYSGIAALVGSVMAETIAETLERVHEQSSPAMGQLCIALEKRRIRPDTIRSWAGALRRGSEDLLALAERMERSNVRS